MTRPSWNAVDLGNRRAAIGARVGLFLVAFASAAFLIAPVRAGQIGFDAAASVLYFDRIVQGRRLEGFITTTPKPLLTLVYGVVYNVFGDWRPISWLVIGMFALSAVLAASLAGRFGGLPAAALAGILVVGSQPLLDDVSRSYAVVWAFAACLGAGLLISSSRPRYGWAGLLLGIGTLARFEVVLILVASLAALAARELWVRYRRCDRTDRRAWLILIGFLAVPIQFAHDWLLSGNVLYSEYVPIHASLVLPHTSPAGTAVLVVHQLAHLWPLVVLAAIGSVVLVRRGAWGILLGLVAMGPGVAAFLVVLAARGIYISSRYLDPIALALLVAAAIGFGVLVSQVHVEVARRWHRAGARWTVLGLTGIAAGVVLSSPFALDSRSFRLAVRDALGSEENVMEALPVVRSAVAATPDARGLPGPSAGSIPILMVPTLLRPQFIVDLGASTGQVSGSAGSLLRTDGTYPVVGQIVVHDRGQDPQVAFAFLEVSVPTTIGGIVVTPLLSDPAHGIWVDRISAAP